MTDECFRQPTLPQEEVAVHLRWKKTKQSEKFTLLVLRGDAISRKDVWYYGAVK